MGRMDDRRRDDDHRRTAVMKRGENIEHPPIEERIVVKPIGEAALDVMPAESKPMAVETKIAAGFMQDIKPMALGTRPEKPILHRNPDIKRNDLRRRGADEDERRRVEIVG